MLKHPAEHFRRRRIIALPSPSGIGWQVWDSGLGWQPTVHKRYRFARLAARKVARRLWHMGRAA